MIPEHEPRLSMNTSFMEGPLPATKDWWYSSLPAKEQGDEIEIICEGDSEERAMEAMVRLVEEELED